MAVNRLWVIHAVSRDVNSFIYKYRVSLNCKTRLVVSSLVSWFAVMVVVVAVAVLVLVVVCVVLLPALCFNEMIVYLSLIGSSYIS